MTFDRLLRIREVCLQTGLSRTYLYQLMASGKAPRPVMLGRARRWKESEVQEFIASLPRAGGDA